jgi:broad specificity phosphatase PhoE
VKARPELGYEKRTSGKWNVRVPGGENYADVAARLENWIADLKSDTFAASHGAATRILRGLFQGLDWKQMSALDEKQGVLYRARGSDLERFACMP